MYAPGKVVNMMHDSVFNAQAGFEELLNESMF